MWVITLRRVTLSVSPQVHQYASFNHNLLFNAHWLWIIQHSDFHMKSVGKKARRNIPPVTALLQSSSSSLSLMYSCKSGQCKTRQLHKIKHLLLVHCSEGFSLKTETSFTLFWKNASWASVNKHRRQISKEVALILDSLFCSFKSLQRWLITLFIINYNVRINQLCSWSLLQKSDEISKLFNFHRFSSLTTWLQMAINRLCWTFTPHTGIKTTHWLPRVFFLCLTGRIIGNWIWNRSKARVRVSAQQEVCFCWLFKLPSILYLIHLQYIWIFTLLLVNSYQPQLQWEWMSHLLESLQL